MTATKTLETHVAETWNSFLFMREFSFSKTQFTPDSGSELDYTRRWDRCFRQYLDYLSSQAKRGGFRQKKR